jgi:hypothetical protein
VQHIVEKIAMRAAMRAIIFLQTSSQSKNYRQNYGPPKIAKVLTLGILGLSLGSLGKIPTMH